MAETTRNHIFSKEISQVIIAAMVLVPNFYWKNCLRVISAMRGNPPLRKPNKKRLCEREIWATWFITQREIKLYTC